MIVHLLLTVTNFGDLGLLLPLSLLTALILATLHSRRAALVWCLSAGLCLGAMLVLKLGFIACGAAVPALDITSPSGHAAMSVATYGGLAALIGRDRPGWLRLGAVAAALGLVTAIALSRVVLRFHTGPEVLVGAAVGTLSVGLLAAGLRTAPARRIDLRALALAAGASALLFHGAVLPAEGVIRSLGWRLNNTVLFCT